MAHAPRRFPRSSIFANPSSPSAMCSATWAAIGRRFDPPSVAPVQQPPAPCPDQISRVRRGHQV
eukprot:3090833-Alexandrium_andersonii.AAC.1